MKLSVITVCYNNLAGLIRTGESVMCQSFKDYEWIVIDGGSTDGTKEYLGSLTPQPAFWCSEPDGGIYNAMNKGIRLARGEYLLFLNSGDTFVDCEVLRQAVLDMPEADIVYGDANFCGKDGCRTVHYPDTFTLYHFWITETPCHQATFIKRALLSDDGYDEAYRIVADYKKWIAWKLEGRSFRHLNVVVCNYMLDGISTTHTELHTQEHDAVIQELLTPQMREQMEYVDWLKNFYEDAVAERDKAIVKHDETIAQRDEAIVECEKNIAECEKAISERDEAIARLSQKTRKHLRGIRLLSVLAAIELLLLAAVLLMPVFSR